MHSRLVRVKVAVETRCRAGGMAHWQELREAHQGGKGAAGGDWIALPNLSSGRAGQMKCRAGHAEGNIRHMKGNMRHLKGNIRHLKGNIRHLKGNLEEVKGNLGAAKGKVGGVNCSTTT